MPLSLPATLIAVTAAATCRQPRRRRRPLRRPPPPLWREGRPKSGRRPRSRRPLAPAASPRDAAAAAWLAETPQRTGGAWRQTRPPHRLRRAWRRRSRCHGQCWALIGHPPPVGARRLAAGVRRWPRRRWRRLPCTPQQRPYSRRVSAWRARLVTWRPIGPLRAHAKVGLSEPDLSEEDAASPARSEPVSNASSDCASEVLAAVAGAAAGAPIAAAACVCAHQVLAAHPRHTGPTYPSPFPVPWRIRAARAGCSPVVAARTSYLSANRDSMCGRPRSGTPSPARPPSRGTRCPARPPSRPRRRPTYEQRNQKMRSDLRNFHNPALPPMPRRRARRTQ